MEGIHYDAEKEDVTLVSIKDENGGALSLIHISFA